MISLSKIIDPLAGYIEKVKSDAEDRNADPNSRYSSEYSKYVQGPATITSAEDTTKAAYANRLTAEINEITSGLKNARDGLSVLDEASKGYDRAIAILNDMKSVVSTVQSSEASGNFLISSDSDDLAATLTAYNSKLQEVVDETNFNETLLLDGNFSNKSFPLWHNESSPAIISLNSLTNDLTAYRTFSAFAITGGLNSNVSSNDISGSINITIAGPDGTQTFKQVADESAATLASRINNVTNKSISSHLGVVAVPRTALRLNGLTDAGTISLSIASDSTAAAGVSTGNVVISDKADLTALMTAVNNVSNQTDVYANLVSGSTSDLILESFLGSNISLLSFAHSVSGGKITAAIDRRDGSNDYSLSDADAGTYGAATGYAGGSIKFDMVGNLTTRSVSLSSSTVSSSAGAVSVNSNNVYLGTGSGSIQIGTVDGTENGQNGSALKVNFSANSRVFDNGTFASDSDWVKNTSQIISGTTQLSGETTLTDTTFPAGNAQGASGTLTVTGGTDGDSMSSVTINGINLFSSSVTYSTDNNTTAALIRAEINNQTGSHGYTATVNNNVVTITAASDSGTNPNSYSISSSSSGSFAASGTSLSGGVDNDKASITGGSPFSTTISGGVATMTTTNATTAYPHTVVKGPAIISNESVFLLKDEQVSFDWNANGQNSDYYDVQAYLVNTNNNRIEAMLNQTGSSASGTASHSVDRTGNYKFVFVSGAYDNDADSDSSSTVTLDNVTVSAITSSVLESIRDKVTYNDLNFSATADNSTPQVSVTPVTGGGVSNTETISIQQNMVGFAMTGGADHEVIGTGEVAILSGSSFSVTQASADLDGSTFFNTSSPAVTSLTLSSISASSSLIEQNATERIAIAIQNLTSIQSQSLNSMKSKFDFGEFDTSNYLRSLQFNEKLSLEPVTAQNLTIATAKMIIASEVTDLLARAGNAVADDVYDLLIN